MFGQYPQATETPEPLKWIVFDSDSPNDQMLLLSKYVLDAYDNSSYSDNPCYSKLAYAPKTWEENPLRRWLNDFFLKAAFSSSEQASIPATLLDPPNNPYGTNGGYATNVKVVLLSIAEANRYFPSDAD